MTVTHDYQRLVAEYAASSDERLLLEIAQLGAKAAASDFPLEEMAEMHNRALVVLDLDPDRAALSDRATVCLSEFLMSFGLTSWGRSQRALEWVKTDTQRHKLEALGQLAAGVAHEFNNLLQPITGLAELALEDNLAADTRETLLTILDSGRKAAGIVRHILTYVRQLTPERRSVPMGRVVQAEIEFLQRTLPASITIESAITDQDSAIVGDPSELGLIMQNLVRNASDAMTGRGVVTVTLRNLAGEKLRLSVRDHGIGMDPDTANRIFEPFYSTKPPGQGTGLGLAMVRGIVEDWDGEIFVETAPGVGTTLTITLPIEKTNG